MLRSGLLRTGKLRSTINYLRKKFYDISTKVSVIIIIIAADRYRCIVVRTQTQLVKNLIKNFFLRLRKSGK